MEAVTVVITRYSEADDVVMSCLQSLKKQTTQINVLFLDQKISNKNNICDNSRCASSAAIIEYESIPAKSLSYARNYGLSKAHTPYVIFCDVDCVLDEKWAEAIVTAFKNTNATIIGTKIVPEWEVPPTWYMKTKYVRDFFSLLDLGEGIKPVSKVVGASFAINKSKMSPDLFFDENLGRQNGRLLSGEETDFCKRVLDDGGEIYYTSHAVAYHQIQRERISFNWLQKRAFYGGFSRSVRRGSIDPFNKNVQIMDKIGIIPFVPAYIAGRLLGFFSR